MLAHLLTLPEMQVAIWTSSIPGEIVLCINEPCCLEFLLHFCKIEKKGVSLYFHEILIQSKFVYFKSAVSGLCGEGLVDQTLVNI